MRRAAIALALLWTAASSVAQTAPSAASPPRPFLVFFDWGKAGINSDAAAVLDQVAASYWRNPSVRVLISGHSDRSGPDAANLRASQRRADAVREFLAGRDVSDSAMSTSAFGEERPLIQTADGVREAQNRRVEIVFGPAPRP